MERDELQVAAATVTHLRGLLAIPAGLLFINTGLSNLGWGPFGPARAFIPTLIALAVLYALLDRYYVARYGRVSVRFVHHLGYAAAIGTGMIVGNILDFRLTPPVSLFASMFAIGMLIWFARFVGIQRRHVVIWGGLLVVALIPIWDSFDDSVSVAWIPIGVATILAGVFDHLALVRFTERIGQSPVEDDHVAA